MWVLGGAALLKLCFLGKNDRIFNGEIRTGQMLCIKHETRLYSPKLNSAGGAVESLRSTVAGVTGLKQAFFKGNG